MTENEISKIVLDAGYQLHVKYGPGLVEMAYEWMMERALRKRGLEVQRQVPIPLEFEGEIFPEAFKADMIVNQKLIIEFKAAETMKPVFKRQLNTYLKVSGLKLGLLMNFGMATFKDGIERIINGQLDDEFED